MREAASRGFWVGSGTPYGYRRTRVQDGMKGRVKLAPDPNTAWVVRSMFELILSGQGVKEIAKTLNSQNIPSPSGKRWGKSRVHDMLVNPVYVVEREAAAQREMVEARQKKELEEKQRPENERIEKEWRARVAASRKVRRRDELDAELRDREQSLKSRELSRSEQRLDNYDAAAADGQVEDADEPLAAFDVPMDGSDLDLAPTAMLQRKDGATLLYDGRLNFLFGAPGGGKSWVALYCVHETLLRGRRAIYWDHEDTPGTLSRRSKLLGLDLADFWGEDQFKIELRFDSHQAC